MGAIHTNTGIELLYRGRDLADPVYEFDESVVEQYNTAVRELGLEILDHRSHISQEFNIPDYYKNLDVEEYIVGCLTDTSPEVIERVGDELALFKARNLYPVLQLLIYIVTVMRDNQVAWGVGRGSSVASYCLYVIGVHRVDPIKYDIPITEFLK